MKICGRAELAQIVARDPNQSAIVIGESPQKTDETQRIVLEYILGAIEESCFLRFDDIIFPEPGKVLATEEHVQQAIDWAKDKNDFIVACHAGISRSSAMMYVVRCSKMDPEEAVTILNYDLHVPNLHVVGLGAKVLNNPKVEQVYLTWSKNPRAFSLVVNDQRGKR